jgi:HEAT repeat protein
MQKKLTTKTVILLFLLFMWRPVYAQTNLAEEVSRQVKLSGSHDNAIRQNAIKALIDMGTPAVPLLINELESERLQQGYERMYLIHSMCIALSRIEDKRALPILYKLLEDEDPSVQIFAAEAISGMGDESLIFDLMKFAMKKTKEIDKDKAKEMAKQLDAENADGLTRLTALSCLMLTTMNIAAGIQNMGEPIIPVLFKGLKHKDDDVRAFSVNCLSNLCRDYPKYKKATLEAFIELLGDQSPLVKQNASYALVSITEVLYKTGEDFGEDKNKWQKWWQENKERF